MPIDVTMPKLSDTMEEGKILRWLKQVGDAVRIGDVLAEVETDKANMELEAYDEGTLAEVRVGEGEGAPVGAVIAVLSQAGEQAPKTAGAAVRPAREVKPAPPPEKPVAKAEPAPEPRPAKAEPAAPQAPVAPPPREQWRPSVVRRPEPAEAAQVRASPLARRIAREHDLDLATIAGTGPGGRIVEKDVEAALAERNAAVPAETAPPVAAVTMRAEGRAVRTEVPPSGARRVELSRIRRTTAKRMSDAKREVPHFYASADVAMDEAVRLKESLVALGEDWVGLTYTHLVLKAVGLALRRVPEVNASFDGDATILHGAVNVGMATATDDGLMVPVVRGCDHEPLGAIVRQARGLVERARAGRFAGDDLSGATFTVSNLGMFPVSEFAAIINPPQAAILAVSAIREVPVVRDGAVVPGRVMTVTLSSDHRLVDGVIAGRFLRELKALLEHPVALVV